MKVKKTIWFPLGLGSILGLLSFVSSAADFLIPIGFSGGATGPHEIALIISASLGGPLGLFIAGLLHEIGIYHYIYKPHFSPGQILSTGVLFAIADFAAHILALLTIAYCYRFLHQRAKKVSIFVAGWILIVAIYYSLLVLLQSLLIRIVFPDLPPVSALFQDFFPEFQVVLIITTLILLALPEKYRKPQWYEPKQTQNQNGGISDELPEGVQ